MPKPSLASRKKVTPENLETLGAARLAQLLAEVADTRVDLKRRLRMELAAGLGPEHLVPEIDKRLAALETSLGQVTWRQNPAVIRDLDALRDLIARLATTAPEAASERLWRFMETAGVVTRRFRERQDAAWAVYERAAADLGQMLVGHDAHLTADRLVEAARAAPQIWSRWLPPLLPGLPKATARLALAKAQGVKLAAPGWALVLRALADAADDVEAFAATFSGPAQATPDVAIEIARRHLAAKAVEAAGAALRLAAPKPTGLRRRLAEPDFDWETAWIDYLAATGDEEAAQAVRWASFQRTLDLGRAKAFTAGLDAFDDVEAEAQAFAYAAGHADLERGLAFLMAWPALAEASRMIETRSDDIAVSPENAELWAGKLRRRFPKAANILLRRSAAAAFRRRQFKASERLTQEADTIALP